MGRPSLRRDGLDDGLDGEHALRPAIAAERGVRHRIGLARQAADADVRQEVAIVDVTQRARQHRRSVIGDAAAIGGERDVEREKAPLAVEADLVADQERMALAGGAHVVIARQPQLHRPPRLPGEHRGDAGDDGRLALLAAEGAAHAPHLDGDGVERQPQQMRDPVLHLGRVLGRAHDVHVAAVAGSGERDLAFEIEMILAAAAQLAGEPMRRGGERGLDLAARHDLRRRDQALARHRLLDAEHCRQRLVFDRDQLCRRARLIERRRRDRGHRLALVLDDIDGEHRLVAADRRDVVLARDVRRRDHGDHARGGERAGEIDVLDARMRMRAQHQGGFERAGHVRDVVEIARRAGDVADRAVVAHRRVHAPANPSQNLAHDRISFTGPPPASAWPTTFRAGSRRRRLPAMRSR